MREIKFRGKSDLFGWVYGSYAIIDGSCHIFEEKDLTEDGHHIRQDSDRPTWVDPNTIGQYTGLKDANGKEIYEGDLLRFPPKSQWEETNYASFEVFFHDGDCCDGHIGYQMNRAHFHGACGGTTFWPFRPKWVNKMVLDGNIHDNPELI